MQLTKLLFVIALIHAAVLEIRSVKAAEDEGKSDVTGEEELGSGSDSDSAEELIIPDGSGGFNNILVPTFRRDHPNFQILDQKNASGLKFLVIGNWGLDSTLTTTSPSSSSFTAHEAIAKQMESYATQRLQGIDFVVSSGDNFYENGVTSPQDIRWTTSFEKYAGFTSSWYAVLGDADYLANAKTKTDAGTLAQIQYSEKSSKWVMPWYYYTKVFAIKDSQKRPFLVQLVFIDTISLMGYEEGGCYWDRGGDIPDYCIEESSIPEKVMQMEWIENTLSTSSAEWLIVVGHHPIYSAGEEGLKKWPESSSTPTVSREIRDLLAKFNVSAYFSSHETLNEVFLARPDYYEMSSGEFMCVVTGSSGRLGGKVQDDAENRLSMMYGGSRLEMKYASSSPGFVSVQVNRSKLSITMVNQSGADVYMTVLGSPRIVDKEALQAAESELLDKDSQLKSGFTTSQIVAIVCLIVVVGVGAGYALYKRAFVNGQFDPHARAVKSQHDHSVSGAKESSVTIGHNKPAFGSKTSGHEVVAPAVKKGNPTQVDAL